MKNELYTTINSGKYKGKKIILPSASTTRSTKSIIKGSFFDTIQFDIMGKNFVEVFAGSGSVGLEALSRGAKKIYFIEKDISAYKILLQNIKSIDMEKCISVRGDSFAEFPKIIENIDEKTYFYFDPPFEFRDGMQEIYPNVYTLMEMIPSEICELITIEHMSSVKVPEAIGIYTKTKSKKFGKTTISYCKYIKDISENQN